MPGHRSFLRLNYYPKRETAHTTGEDDLPLNCVEHFDSGFITLLYQDDIGGLEVQRRVCRSFSKKNVCQKK